MIANVHRAACCPAIAGVLMLVLAPVAADLEVGGIVLREGPQDLVEVTAREWAWTSGPDRFPCVSVRLQSGRFTYTVRHDQKYGGGRIGIAEPTIVNWYQSEMLDLYINGTRLDLLPENNETLEMLSGRRGMAVFSWEDERVRAAFSFVLLAGQDRLLLEIALEPKVEITDISLRLRNFPSGTNREPIHVLHTPVRTLDIHGRHDLDPLLDNGVFYADEALDVATNPAAQGPCALAFDGAEVTSAHVTTGEYGINTSLRYEPTARRLRLALWEFPARSNADALEHFRATLPDALESLADPHTFAR